MGESEYDRDGDSNAIQEPSAEYTFKMHANPRTTGIENRFFIQAYEKSGYELIPRDVLYIGAPDRCQELLSALLDGKYTPEQVKAVDRVADLFPTEDAREKASIREALRRRTEQGTGREKPTKKPREPEL